MVGYPVPDGTLLKLERVTSGTEHHFVQQARWQKAFDPVLPAALRGAEVCTLATPRDAFVFWFMRPGVPRGTAWCTHAVLCDDHGCAAVSTGEPGPFVDRPEPPKCLIFEWLPRRSETLGLRLYDLQGQPVTEVTVPNPAYARFPAWTPEPYLITKQVNGLTVIVTGLTAGLSRREPYGAAVPGEERMTRITYRVSENGTTSRRWQVVRVGLADATGNAILDEFQRGKMVSYTDEESDTELWFGSGLCAAEAAWKVELVLASDDAQEEHRVVELLAKSSRP